MLNEISNWISNNYFEILGTLFSIIYVYFSIKQNILLWPLGIISSAIYISIFFHSKIYADMSLQIYYVIISIYGWYFWLHGNKKTNNKKIVLKVRKSSYKQLIIIALSILVLFLIISKILIYFTDSEIPYWDAFTTAASIVATWMLAKKYIEHWIIWIIVDIISSGLYYYKDLYFTIFLYLVYTSMAFIGYYQWNKELQANSE
ncbi:MAG: nicotinamide mononucleotide transporter [Bacteroidales bacterium]|nr:nicotinamide mononucleotide transporter [Bacteroidales bacterium]MBN2756614.1 nicotinamide mononucleotide transporter [Bacteroidales bacterium]